MGVRGYIRFKSNTTRQASPRWRRLDAFFTLHEAEFNARYRQRSKVEKVFSMVKGEFGNAGRAKSETDQVKRGPAKVPGS